MAEGSASGAVSAAALLEVAADALRLDRVRAARELYDHALVVSVDDETRGEALAGLGHTAYRSGRPGDAVALIDEALTALRASAPARPDLADVLGRALAEVGELDRAIRIFEECRQGFRREGDRVNEIRFACLSGYALTDRGRFEEAERALDDALEAGEETVDATTRARLFWAQARLRGEQGRTALAAEHARSALSVLATTGDDHSLALTYELLASLYNDLGRSDEALALLREGFPMLMKSGSPLEVVHYRLEEARALAALGETEGAAALAMRIAAQLGETLPGDAGRAHVLLGEIFDGLGDASVAHEHYATGIALLEAQGPSRYLAAAYKRLGVLFEAEYRSKDAIAVLKSALAVQRRVEQTYAPVA
jgi:tetratricopeptide (TPR) repeat protein